jgi:xanthine dehydrogenase YagT iron-sulfur-binding subunit
MAQFSSTRRQLLKMSAAASGALAATPLMSANAPAARKGGSASQGAASVRVRLRINGNDHELALDARTTLLDALRERLHLTGTKKGCGLGQCGACTVLIDGKRMKSCLQLAALVEGSDIQTIEGLANGESLHPLQAAFVERDGFQCGYCTAGQIMSGVGCIAEGHANSAAEIREWMNGNLCRCGAYDHIVVAIQDAAARRGS